MTAAGWIIMVSSVFGVTGLFVWCIFKVLSLPGATEHLHAQTDIDPHDQE